LALAVIEIRRDGDDRLGDFLAEVVLGCALQLTQHVGADLGRRDLLAVDLERTVAVFAAHDREGHALVIILADLVEAAADEALGREHGVLGVGDALALGDLADEDLPLVIPGNDRRRDAIAFLVDDHFRLFAFHDRDHGVRGAQVDADDLSHVA